MDGSEFVSRLKDLSELHSAGAITDEEFAAARPRCWPNRHHPALPPVPAQLRSPLPWEVLAVLECGQLGVRVSLRPTTWPFRGPNSTVHSTSKPRYPQGTAYTVRASRAAAHRVCSPRPPLFW